MMCDRHIQEQICDNLNDEILICTPLNIYIGASKLYCIELDAKFNWSQKFCESLQSLYNARFGVHTNGPCCKYIKLLLRDKFTKEL